jgi:DNA (cytosine-5)-methyltransferase 1
VKVYYNEFDKKKCAALLQLMKDGHITKGDIDDRSITDVQPGDLQGYERAHFFAGIGLWDHALNLARWKEGDRVWTGSCPCQPFSAAGRQKGKADDRHLWPEWERLIKECQPSTIFGEQVASAVAKGWLDDVYQGLEAEGYAIGSIVLPASSVGAPHRRERLWFVADLQGKQRDERQNGNSIKECGEEGVQSEIRTSGGTLGDTKHNGHATGTEQGSNGQAVLNDAQGKNSASEFEGASDSSDVANSDSLGLQKERPEQQTTRATRDSEEYCSSNVANSECKRLSGQGELQRSVHPETCGEGQASQPVYDSSRHWQDGEWVDCPDGKQRLIEPRIPLLAHGYPERVGVIHSAGDAIVPQVAAEFISAYMEVER